MRKMFFISFLFSILMISVVHLRVFAQEVNQLPSSSSLDAPLTPLLNTDPIANMDTVVPDQFTGSMKYSIPILVPVGRNGIEPKLELTYRSSQQNGWVGLGWELEVGSIERNTKKGVDYNGDSYILRMNGATIELVNKNGTYQEKIESAFNRIMAYKDDTGRPIYWEITDKTGHLYRFGETADTRQHDPDDSTTTTRVFKWCLNRIVDANGNYMNFFYSKDQGQIYLDHIDYTGNGSIAPDNTVKFVKDNGVTRLDKMPMFKTNFGVITAYRLQRIEVYGGGNLVRSYEIEYTISAVTSLSLLSAVQEHGVGTEANSLLPPVTMQYSLESTGFSISGWASLGAFQCHPYFYPTSNYVFGDFTGDGRTDGLVANICNAFNLEVWASSGSGFAGPNNWKGMGEEFVWRNMVLADFNGDGTPDILLMPITAMIPDYNFLNVMLSQPGGGFGSLTNWLSMGTRDLSRLSIADFDGDGKSDIIYVDVSGQLLVSVSTGTTFISQASSIETSNIDGNYADKTRYRFVDFNGDGKTDVLYIDNSSNLWVAVSTGTGFSNFETWGNVGLGSKPAQYGAADFNGDGNDDIIYVDPTGNLQVALSTGSRFAAATSWGSAGNGDMLRYKFADFDGNGKLDILYINGSGGLLVALSSTPSI